MRRIYKENWRFSTSESPCLSDKRFERYQS